MTDARQPRLSDADVRLLTMAQAGHTFRPSDAAEGVFDVLVDHLRSLRARGLLRLEEGRIMKSQRELEYVEARLARREPEGMPWPAEALQPAESVV